MRARGSGDLRPEGLESGVADPAGPTASDIMNNLPSVSVDQQTGNISLRGNENVRVMVDGKLSNVPVAQLLKQIPSTSIKQIELITNPSAKYNPEGMSGIINIILHKNVNIGFNGDLSTGLTFDEVNFDTYLLLFEFVYFPEL